MVLPNLPRRAVLAGLSGAALIGRSEAQAAPRFSVPAGACDCHLHIYDPRFPYLPSARLQPPPATATDYKAVQRMLGTTRCIIVQPSTYGDDNRCTIDAVQQLGDAARGIVRAGVDTPLDELKRFDRAGVRGVRISSGTTPADIVTIARRIEPLGWHLQFSLTPEGYLALADVLPTLPTNIVLDHFAQSRMPEDGSSEHHRLLLRLLDGGRTWMKLSSPYSNSKTGAPDYADMAVLARDLIARAPERMVWGTNWPYPEVTGAARPDTLDTLNLLGTWAPNPAVRNRILVDNAEALYGFSPLKRPVSGTAGG